jgi:hypothetical protein
MKFGSITKAIFEQLKQNGWQGKIVSLEHLRDLEKEIETRYQNGVLNQEFYDGYMLQA